MVKPTYVLIFSEATNNATKIKSPANKQFVLNLHMRPAPKINFIVMRVTYVVCISKYVHCTVWSSKIDHRPRNMILIKNPQFSSNFYETLSKYPTHELVILAKCHTNWVKIVDFLLIA